jgi:hypothetical protein
MALPRALLLLIDPAQVYVDRHAADRRQHGPPLHPGAAVSGPGVPGGSRPATDDERVALAEEAARYRGDHEAALTDVRRRWAPQLERAAEELLDTGTTHVRLADRTVDARMITFWRGDHLLQTVTQAPRGGGRSLTRISRDPRRGGPDVLLDLLARAAAKGRPVR